METFVKHPEFQQLNIGFALDEGITQSSHSVAALRHPKHGNDCFSVND